MEESENTTNERQLKVYHKYIPRSYYGHVIFPEVRLCGKWLRDTGFDCGQSVTIRHEKNKIIITVDNETEADEQKLTLTAVLRNWGFSQTLKSVL